MMDKSILRKLSYGVYVITTKEESYLYGCVANSVMQINSDIIAISLNKENHTTTAILNTKKIGINILGINTNKELIETFGFKKSKEYNKYKNVSYEIKDNVPILSNTCGYIIGNLVNVTESDTHLILLIRISDMVKTSDEEPMTYSYYHSVLKGKTNMTAPTYQDENIIENKIKHVFICKVCGYQYETDLDELPNNFKCPMCGMDKENFEKLQ